MIKKILPLFAYNFIRDLRHKIPVFLSFYYDFKRYYNYSVSRRKDSKAKLLAEIIRDYHVLEKGLTMPNTRLGFGKERVVKLSNLCTMFESNYGNNEPQLLQAVAVLMEYRQFHQNENYNLDPLVLNELSKIELKFRKVEPTKQKRVTRIEYFNNVNNAFDLFSNSRASVRNFTSEDIPLEKLDSVLKLVRNTPSACNRQASRVYVYSEKDKIEEILQAQGGNRGFGHLTNKLLVITSDLNAFFNSQERNEAFIDGGMFAMNILYALHFNEIAGCILNCSHTPKKDRLMRELCGIKKSEVFIGMIACGIPPENFSVALSKRNQSKEFVKSFN